MWRWMESGDEKTGKEKKKEEEMLTGRQTGKSEDVAAAVSTERKWRTQQQKHNAVQPRIFW